jgi:murein DD-endopeptidase MepM/ murein hydrolase activator NlpD
MKKIFFKKLPIALSLIFALIFALSATSVAAQTRQELEQQQRDLRGQIQETQADIEVTQLEISALQYDIYAMDMALAHAEEQLEATELMLADTIAELQQTEIELEEARRERDEHFENFKTRLRVMYIHGPVGYLEVVLQATSFSDFLTRLDHMNTIARSDREITYRLKEAEAVVEEKLEETFRQKIRIEGLMILQAERVAEFEAISAQQYQFMYNLVRDAHQHEAALRQFQQSDADITQRLYAMRADEARRQREAQAAARAAGQVVVQPSGGTMYWPVPASRRVTSGYGNRTHPFSRRQEFHTGIDIGAPSGSEIRAARGGNVIMSGWHGGFGNTVILEHGDGLTTLYAHNRRNRVSVGQWVNGNAHIADVGNTGVSTGPHLHFEVRRNGRHVNPGPFLGI